MLFWLVGEVELAGIATVTGILNNELPFEIAAICRLLLAQNDFAFSWCDSEFAVRFTAYILLSFTHHFLPTVSSGGH